MSSNSEQDAHDRDKEPDLCAACLNAKIKQELDRLMYGTGLVKQSADGHQDWVDPFMMTISD